MNKLIIDIDTTKGMKLMKKCITSFKGVLLEALEYWEEDTKTPYTSADFSKYDEYEILILSMLVMYLAWLGDSNELNAYDGFLVHDFGEKESFFDYITDRVQLYSL